MFAESQKLMDQNRFGEAYRLLYHFVWDDLADWYLKPPKRLQMAPLMAYLLESVLRVCIRLHRLLQKRCGRHWSGSRIQFWPRRNILLCSRRLLRPRAGV